MTKSYLQGILDSMRKVRNNFYSQILKKPRIYYKKPSNLEVYKKNKRGYFLLDKKFLKPYRKIRVIKNDEVESLKKKIKTIF